MKRRYVFILTLLLLFIIIIYVFYPSDENRIRKTISSSEKAVISEDIDRFMESVSFNYQDDYGNNYLRLKKILQTSFKRLSDIGIEKNIRKISVNDPFAEVTILIRVTASDGHETGYIMGDAIDAKQISVFLQKSSYKWLIVKVEGVIDK